jgi:predicted deacylase
MAVETQISSNVDYDKNGKQFGYLNVPQSFNTSGWASVFVPIAVIKNGKGHGDEYEGQVTLMKLARSLKPEQVQGRLILIPMLNRPAAENGTRLSPLDGRNMNRAFPGKFDDTITGLIAHYVSQVLLPRADLVIDIHSGGRSMHFLPSVNMHDVPNKKQMRKMVDAGIAWGAPYVFIYRDVGGVGLYPGYAESLGKVTLGTEIGGAGQFGKEMLSIADTGLKNVLKMYGILEGQPKAAKAPQVVAADRAEDYIMAPVSGIFEPFLELGDEISAGKPIGQIHSTEQPFHAPTPVLAATDGIVMSRKSFPLTRQGDNCMVLVRPFSL